MKTSKLLLYTIIILIFSYINLFSAESGTAVNFTNGLQGTSTLSGVSTGALQSLLQKNSSQGQSTASFNKLSNQGVQLNNEQNQSTSSKNNLEGLDKLGIGEYPAELLGELTKKKNNNLLNVNKNTLFNISPLEKGFYSLTKVHLKQFGYNFFKGQPRLTFSIPVDKNYVLGPGDELFLYIIGGSINSNLADIKKLVVDREGKIYLPGIGIFYVWGLTLGNAESIISKALSANIKLTVGRLRTFPVYVSGEVNRPGAVMVTGVNTVIDALMMAGGIKKTGTLRDIIVTRKIGKKVKKFHIDFYKLLLKGEQIDFRLRDNDVIFVKTIGKTTGIIGKVKRPAIYEIKKGATIKDLINLSGGLLPSSYRLKVSLQRYKENLYLEIKEGTLDNRTFMNQKLKDGDIISIKEIINLPQNAVQVLGATPYPGLYEYKNNMHLSDILTDDLFYKDTNMNFALIVRQYPTGSNPQYITFSPLEILNKKRDIPLLPTDQIYLFKYNFLNVNIKRIKNLVILKGYIKYPSIFAYRKDLKLSEVFNKNQLNIDTNIKFAVIIRTFPEGTPPKYITFIPEDILQKQYDIKLMPGDIINFYKFGEKKIDFNKIKNVVVLEGEVLYPGVYAFKKGMRVSDILKKDILTMNTDLNYGEIERRDPNTFKLINIIKFSPINILNGKKDKQLHRFDVIRLFPRNVFAPIKISGDVKRSIVVPYHFGIKLIDALSKADFSEDLKNLKVEIFREVSRNKSINELEKAENIKGVAESAQEIVAKNLNSIFLYDLLIARNPKLNIPLNPGDRLLIKKVAKDEVVEKVEVQGYVEKPGVYSITEKTTLYDILKQAGGFRKNAYPDGIIFTREMIKKMQQQRLTKAIFEMRQEIEKEQAGIMQSDLPSSEKSARMESFEAKRRLLNLMANTKVNGRISGLIIPKDINKLKNSISNIFLMNGDKIYVPKRPASVMIFGEVYNPTALVVIKDYKVKDYISDAGGLTKDADKENIFVIKSNGAVVTSSNMYKSSHWDGRNPEIWGIPFLFSKSIMNYKLEPGDAVVVPLKVKVPIFWRPLIRDVMQIIYQSVLTSYTIIHLNN